MSQDEDDRDYRVLVNEEEQYSLWLAALDIPKGWRDCGIVGKKAECLAYVKEVWTDMRPLSLRRSMEQHQAQAQAQAQASDASESS